ncbi:MAG: hypothetical protein ABI673_02995 [Novosphingobium sp.]
MKPPERLDPAATALFALGRFRRLMRLLLAVTVAVVILAGVLLYRHGMAAPVQGVILTGLAVALVMLLASAAIGLAFLRMVLRARQNAFKPDALKPDAFKQDGAENPPPERRRSGVPE